MPKTKTKKAVVRQIARIQQAHAEPIVRTTEAVRRAAQKRPQRTGLAWFINEFPWLSGILTVAILAGLVGAAATYHVGPFQLPPNPCAWGTMTASQPAAKGATIQRTYSAAPPVCINTTKGLYEAHIHTKYGTIDIVMDQTQTPITVNNFVFLATHHFYDGLTFHRVVTNPNVAQGGDPYSAIPADASKVGTGGPGYHIPDEYPMKATVYRLGAVAMANSGTGTTGSQFFICRSDLSTALQPNYNMLGNLTVASYPVMQKLQQGDVIQSITITYNPKGDPGVDTSGGVVPTATATP
jgi:peptidylprolyl isomerase